MKKSVLSLMVGTALLISPLAASAMTPMTASGMKDATGQAGVSIALDDIKLESFVGATTYTDDDGYVTLLESAAGATNGSTSITIGNKHTVKYINAIIGGATSAKAQALSGQAHTYVNTMDAGTPAVVDNTDPLNPVIITPAVAPAQTLFETKALTIDAGTCRLLTAGLTANKTAAAAGTALAGFALLPTTNIAGVVIGLPTVEIVTSSDSYDISVSQAGALNSGKKFINISKGASSLAILGGVVEIAPH